MSMHGVEEEGINTLFTGVNMNIRVFMLFGLLCLTINIAAQVLPHPQRIESLPEELIGDDFTSEVKNIFFTRDSRIDLTNNVLVLRIAFPDHPFQTEETFPSFHPHNAEYFRKYMQHVKNFYLDASGGKYELNYFLAPEIYTMSNNLSYYGDDATESRRRVEMIGELIELIGETLPFKNYEALIVFHSAAGQESDIFNTQRHTLWSTFMSINTFRSVFDPGNLNYPGIPTADGSFVTKTALVASSEFHPDFLTHPDFESNQNAFHYEILGVLATQLGRVIGLPTLFGNVSAFGSHAGTGNFCIMGTGTWNNDGRTPPLPSAWVRYFAGWVEPVEIEQNMEGVQITYPMAEWVSGVHTDEESINASLLRKSEISATERTSALSTVYKINISEKEYFLIENRQHNFIKDFY